MNVTPEFHLDTGMTLTTFLFLITYGQQLVAGRQIASVFEPMINDSRRQSKAVWAGAIG